MDLQLRWLVINRLSITNLCRPSIELLVLPPKAESAAKRIDKGFILKILGETYECLCLNREIALGSGSKPRLWAVCVALHISDRHVGQVAAEGL
jgi:hypothetical protein